MKPILAALLAALVLVGCRDDGAGVTTETSPTGIEYARLYIPDAQQISIQIAWPTDWAMREDVNQAAPFIGADLILAGGAGDFPAGKVAERFADMKADGRLSVTADYIYGQLAAPVDQMPDAVLIAAAHLSKPALNQNWFDRIQHGFADNMTQMAARPAIEAQDALRWAVLGDTPLRRALATIPVDQVNALTRDQVAEWHRQSFTRRGMKVVIAGRVDRTAAGKMIDTLLQDLPQGSRGNVMPVTADFAPRRILLHVPDAQTSTLVLMGPLPPIRDGGEIEDVVLADTFGGDDTSVLFEAVRTRLRASYGFGAGLDGYTRNLRFLVMSGTVETAKLAEAESAVRAAYAEFRAHPSVDDLAIRKARLATDREHLAEAPDAAAFASLMALLDGQHPAIALNLPEMIEDITAAQMVARAGTAFPAADRLITIATSPDAAALPGACVITTPAMAADCP